LKQWEYVIPPTVQELAVRGHCEQSANAEMLEKLINAKTKSTVARKLFICCLLARTYRAFGGIHPRPGSRPACLSWHPRSLETLKAILGSATDLVRTTSMASHCLIGVFDQFSIWISL
jgi:hypothetical protein